VPLAAAGTDEITSPRRPLATANVVPQLQGTRNMRSGGLGFALCSDLRRDFTTLVYASSTVAYDFFLR
jgi:hypothetical protein